MVKFNYTYDAIGTRVSKKVEPTSGTTVTSDYLGGFQYENNDLQFFFQPEGYVKKDENAYLYVFQYKDHLGNVRLSYADCNNNGSIEPASEILEENNYYPFGLKHQGYNDISNSCKSEQAEKYQYNGKEFEDSFGLNIYEMDLRQYDPAIGRWTVQDPVVHHEFSPYSAFDNNPAYWADPSGADAISWIDSEGNLLGATFTGSDAMYAFLFLTGQSSADFLETLTMQVYEFDDIDDSGGGGGGGGFGNGHGGGNRNDSQPLPIEYQIANQLGRDYGYTWNEQKQIVQWLKDHPMIIEDGILRLQGVNGLQVNLNNSDYTVDQLTDKIVKAGGKQVFKKFISSLANKTVGTVINMTLTGLPGNNYPENTQHEQNLQLLNAPVAKMSLINYLFQRDVTIEGPSMLNNMTRTVNVNQYSIWDIYYR